MSKIENVIALVSSENAKRNPPMPHRGGQLVVLCRGGRVVATRGPGKSNNVFGITAGMNGGVDTRPRSDGQSAGSVDRQIGATLGSIGGVVPTASSLWRKAGL